MANIFDKDTATTDNHLLNEQFHAFSKSPSSPGSTLGGASNRSGHTVSASDVWAEKIPAFFYPKADSDYAVCKANAKLNDICRWGDEIQIWDGEKFVKFADNYAAIPDGHEFLNEDGQPVVRFHKSRVAYNLNDTNNAYDNSLDASGKGASAKILGWDKTANDGAGGVYTYVESAPQFITQFVAPTDNIVKGVPSKGYGPIVMVGGSPLTEDADSTAGYIANNFAGIIQFNERKTQGTVTVHAFEYCGKTLGTTASDIAELEDKLSKISVTAAGGVQSLSDAAKSAGFEIDSVVAEGVTTPTLDLTTATVTDGIVKTGDESKLVTAGNASAIAQKAITTSLAGTTTGTIGKAIADVKSTADSAVQSVSRAAGSSTLLTVTDGTNATISLSTEVATKSDITTEINKLTAADGAITALDGRVDAIETSLADGGTIHELIDTAQAAADGKVANITVDGTSIVTGNTGSKTAALTTTKGVEITPSAVSASTALATEASVAKALASITSVGVSYEVIPDGQTHTSITAPVKGRIYLEKDTTNAEAGVYIEWMYTEKGWEQIGSTKTDHSSYASTITVNGSTKTVANSAVDLGAFASSVTAGNGVASGSVSATGALSLTLTTASTSTAGITKLDSTIAGSTSVTTAATPKAVKEYADTKVGSVQVGNEADVLGLTATIEEGTLKINGHYYDTIKNDTGHITGELVVWARDNGIKRVINNRAYTGDNGDILTAIVETDKIVNGLYMFSDSYLFEFSSDLSSLTDGKSMFYNTNLSEFSSDLSILTTGATMFTHCNELKSFCGDLSSLTDGKLMFYDCKKLKSFCGDLSSLTDGREMFVDCKLDTESVESIADSIKDVTGLELSSSVTKRIHVSIGNNTPNDEEDAAFKQMQDKGWDVYVNGYEEYVPRTSEASLDETGETTVAPKPYWAKPIEVTEEEAKFVGEDGKFYQVVGGQFIYVTDPDTYGMFVSLEDAVANMRLTKYKKPVEEA